ncbi:MAG: HEAT repeat domain-containing protein [Spirochaetia bacterium]|jgi:hypothetical protein
MKSFPAFGIMLRSRGQREELRALLEKNSGLPGPRGNLELAHSFADAVAHMRLEDWQWDFLLELASTSASKAPVNTPKEFLPFCGLLALGALYGTGLPRPRRRMALAALKAAASDKRWRTREAVAQGLQLIGEKDLPALREIVTDWLPESSLLEKRAIAAALAHPPILKDPDFALFSLEVSRTILASVSRLDAKSRKDEAFKILRQGLGYCLSVFVQHCPAEGFALMRKSAAVRDPDMAWILRENLKKKRLYEKHEEDVQQVAMILEEANAR